MDCKTSNSFDNTSGDHEDPQPTDNEGARTTDSEKLKFRRQT